MARFAVCMVSGPWASGWERGNRGYHITAVVLEQRVLELPTTGEQSGFSNELRPTYNQNGGNASAQISDNDSTYLEPFVSIQGIP